jgi:autoinducer 2-degrading protein
MYVVAGTIFVKPQNLAPFIEATLDNARNTRKEPGNLRFDVSQAEDDPTRFLLYEVYREKDDFREALSRPSTTRGGRIPSRTGWRSRA